MNGAFSGFSPSEKEATAAFLATAVRVEPESSSADTTPVIHTYSPPSSDNRNSSPRNPVVQFACLERAPEPVFAVSESFATTVANTVVAFAKDSIKTERDYSSLSRDIRELDVIKTQLEGENLVLQDKVRVYRSAIDKLQRNLQIECACPACSQFVARLKAGLQFLFY